MSGRPRSELASEEASAMPQESVRQIQLKECVFFLCLTFAGQFLCQSFFLFQFITHILTEACIGNEFTDEAVNGAL